MSLSLLIVDPLEPGGSGLECGAQPPPPAVSQIAGGGVNCRNGLHVSGPAGRGECLRRSHDETAGAKPGASPVDRTIVNVGTIEISFPSRG